MWAVGMEGRPQDFNSCDWVGNLTETDYGRMAQGRIPVLVTRGLR